MLVGDVRCATVGAGASWKLSGGSQLSSGVTKVSKYRHVRRAVRRRAWASASEIAARLSGAGGRLIHRATAGEISQSATMGAAAGHAPRPNSSVTIRAARATPSAPIMCNAKPRRSSRLPAVARAAGVHSSRWRRLTNIRHSVRDDGVAQHPGLIGEENDVQRRQESWPSESPRRARVRDWRSKRRGAAPEGPKSRE